MIIGDVTMDGMQIGLIEINLSSEIQSFPEYDESLSKGDDIDLGGRTRLGHKYGFYPGAKERQDIRLGHKHGFHPGANAAANAAAKHDGTGAPSAILDQARNVALHGGPAAVSRYMAEQGYPKNGAWCGEFAASIVKGAGGNPPKDPAIASNWRNWGTVTDTPQPGDIAIRRGARTGSTGSHVTIVEEINPTTGRFIGIGGNQGRMESNFPTGQYEFRHGNSSPNYSGPRDGTITNKVTPGVPVRGSYFSDPSTATGLSAATTPGIALPSREGLGKMHEVTGPDGQKVMLPQIDVGPAKWTGRGIDISKAALGKLGYTEKNFPTDAPFSYRRTDGHNGPNLNKKIEDYSPDELKDKADNQSAGSWRYPIGKEDKED